MCACAVFVSYCGVLQLSAMKDVYAAEMQKREDAYALRIEQAVGVVRGVAVAHVQQETDVVKAVASSEMQQEIASAQEALSQEYAAKTAERVRMVQSLKAKLAALDHHLSVRFVHSSCCFA
jgi:predicted ATP-dependent protease